MSSSRLSRTSLWIPCSDKRGEAPVRKVPSPVPAAVTAVTTPENEATVVPASAADQPGQSCPVPVKISRTTAWRQRKREAANQAKQQAQPEQRKPNRPRTYMCRVCGKPMASDGHTQFAGQRYCPETPGIPPKEQWLQQKREEKAASKKSQEAE